MPFLTWKTLNICHRINTLCIVKTHEIRRKIMLQNVRAAEKASNHWHSSHESKMQHTNTNTYIYCIFGCRSNDAFAAREHTHKISSSSSYPICCVPFGSTHSLPFQTSFVRNGNAFLPCLLYLAAHPRILNTHRKHRNDLATRRSFVNFFFLRQARYKNSRDKAFNMLASAYNSPNNHISTRCRSRCLFTHAHTQTHMPDADEMVKEWNRHKWRQMSAYHRFCSFLPLLLLLSSCPFSISLFEQFIFIFPFEMLFLLFLLIFLDFFAMYVCLIRPFGFVAFQTFACFITLDCWMLVAHRLFHSVFFSYCFAVIFFHVWLLRFSRIVVAAATAERHSHTA